MMAIDTPLVLDHFKAWLDRRVKMGPDDVGVRSRDCDCPIATYLYEITGNVYSVNGRNYSPIGTGRVYSTLSDTPKWARIFISMIDNRRCCDHQQTTVYAREAWEALYYVEQIQQYSVTE